MKDWLLEWLLVLAHSRRSQACLLVGLMFFLLTFILGHVLITRVEVGGVFASLSDSMRERLWNRYEKLAWTILATYLIATVRCLRKDRRRLLHL